MLRLSDDILSLASEISNLAPTMPLIPGLGMSEEADWINKNLSKVTCRDADLSEFIIDPELISFLTSEALLSIAPQLLVNYPENYEIQWRIAVRLVDALSGNAIRCHSIFANLDFDIYLRLASRLKLDIGLR